jgi:hypothetical protein
MRSVPGPLDLIRDRVSGFLTNLEAGPPWPEKLVPLLRNRARATLHGCCGNPGEPGC